MDESRTGADGGGTIRDWLAYGPRCGSGLFFCYALARGLFDWLACYPLLLACTGGLLVMVYPGGQSASSVGLPYLFWHHVWWVKLLAGFALALFFAESAFVGYLLASCESWMCPPGEHGFDLEELNCRRLSYLLAMTLMPLGLIALMLLVLKGETGWALIVGLAVGGLASGVFLVWLLHLPDERIKSLKSAAGDAEPAEGGQSRESAVGPTQPRAGNGLRREIADRLKANLMARPRHATATAAQRARLETAVESVADEIYRVHRWAKGFFVSLLLLYVALAAVDTRWSEIAHFITPAVSICVLLGLLVAAYGAVVFYFRQRHAGVSIFVAVAAIFLCSLGDYPHRFREMDYKQPVALEDFQVTEFPPVEDTTAWANWYDRNKPATDRDPKPKIIVIATSGGGLRAAVWTTTVLLELEQEIDDFAGRVRLITGASGGMLGAAYYVASLPTPVGTDPPARHQNPDDMIKSIGRDSLSAPARELVLRDLPLALFGHLNRYDRGWALEETFEEHSGDCLQQPLVHLADGEREGWRPSLVFSPMVVETGRRLLISNLNVEFLTKNRGPSVAPHLPGVDDNLYSEEAAQFFSLFPDAAGLRLSTAVRMNASFPYVSPDGHLPTVPARRVVDAGYYDNYGVNLAVRWLAHHAEDLKAMTSGIAFVQIRDEATESQRTSIHSIGDSTPSLLERGLSWLLTPLEGAVAARDSSMSFRNDEELAAVAELLDPRNEGFFTSVTLELSAQAPLNWYLTDGQVREIATNVKAEANNLNCERIQSLKDWLAKTR